jgi:hypothetical protein
MSEYLNQFFATDKDIFDLLASAKQKLTENVLREIARERGIFYSQNDSREDLADALSLLPFTLNELVDLMDRRETSRRNEKTTTITLDATLEVDDIKAAIKEYQDEVGPTEKVDSHLKGANEVVLNVEYDEMDYSRTRLIQRQRHDATIQFVQQNGKTLVRLPASEKSQRIVENLTSRIESRRKAVVPRETIELDGDFGADERTAFFTRLMSELPGYKLKGVTNLRISPSRRSDTETDDEEELDDDERELDGLRGVSGPAQARLLHHSYHLARRPDFDSLRLPASACRVRGWRGWHWVQVLSKRHLPLSRGLLHQDRAACR